MNKEVFFQSIKSQIMIKLKHDGYKMEGDILEYEAHMEARDVFFDEFGEEYEGDFDDDPFTHPSLEKR
jgi:hypothetical protein